MVFIQKTYGVSFNIFSKSKSCQSISFGTDICAKKDRFCGFCDKTIVYFDRPLDTYYYLARKNCPIR